MFKHIFNDDENLFDLMMRWHGYNITGNMDYNYCMFNYGPSASNGKSTISNIFKSMFTKYVINLSSDTFNTNSIQTRDKSLVELAGKRFACANELDNDALSGDLFKTLSGDEYYCCKLLYKNTIDIKLTANQI